MIKSFEPVYNELEELFIKRLPDYIQKINMKYHDNLILQLFANTKLDEKCIKRPSFYFELKQYEYSEKDRIIEVSAFNIEIKLQLDEACIVAIFWRYVEAISMMIEEYESNLQFNITYIFDNTIEISIFNE